MRESAAARTLFPWWCASLLSLSLIGCASVKSLDTLAAAPSAGGSPSANPGAVKSKDRPALTTASASTAQATNVNLGKNMVLTLTPNEPRTVGQALVSGGKAGNVAVASVGRGGVNAPPMRTRDQKSLAKLFAKKNVSGSELLVELKSVRTLLQNKGVSALVTGFLGDSSSGTEAGAKPPSLAEQLKGVAIEAGLSALDSGSSGSMFASSVDALRQHLNLLIDDSGSMAKETITLPDADGMTPRQMQKAVNLAAMTLATRVSGRMLNKAQEDFKGIESEYAELIERREKAATVLYGLLSQEDAVPSEVKGSFSSGDLEFLRSRVSTMSLAQFSSDMGVQQLALNHLKKSDPQAWQDYSRKSGHAVKGTQGIVKTLTGVAAFGGMAAYVGRDVVSMARKRQYVDLVQLAPLLTSFSTEAAPLLSYSASAAYTGVEVALKPTKRYRVQSGESSEEVGSAADLFALLHKLGIDPALQAALFRDDHPGLLYRLYQCDATEAGQMLDAAVEPSLRDKFFADYRVGPQSEATFAKSLGRKTGASSSLGEDLLQRDHRERTDARSRPIADVQKVVAGAGDGAAAPGFRNWGDEQILRLIFVNREGSAQHAALQLGGVTIRPVPTAQSIYAYETLVDGCRRHLVALDGDGSTGDASAGDKGKPGKSLKAVKPTQPAKADGQAVHGPSPAPQS